MSDKTHGTVENMAIRYDSYEHKDAYFQTVLDDCRIVEVERVFNNYDEEISPFGTRVYFLCPLCKSRVRYLYANNEGGKVACRKCWGLNYKSQQTTKGLDMERLRMEKAVDGMGIWRYSDLLNAPIPAKRPRGISRKQFLTNRQRYYKAREDWHARWIAGALRIIGTMKER